MTMRQRIAVAWLAAIVVGPGMYLWVGPWHYNWWEMLLTIPLVGTFLTLIIWAMGTKPWR
jgi:hypothetical protein